MRLRSRGPRHVRAWVDGVIEGAEPDLALGGDGTALGLLDSGENFVATEAGRLAVRGGSQTKQTFLEPGGQPLTRMLALAPWSAVGAAAVGHYAAGSRHYLYRLTDELAFATGVEASSRHDLGWNIATSARPQIVELFERLYAADATETFAARQSLKAVDDTGAVSTPSFNFGSGAAALQPYCIESFNGVLFIAGHDGRTGEGLNEPAIVRHSFLARAPEAANGFDADAWQLFGAKGQRVTAMKAGRSVLLVAKEHELYRVTGEGRAVEGWQYVTQRLDSSIGFGCVNAYALVYYDGYWYGIGANGPWRSDGETVESLVGARRRSWARTTQLGKAWVAVHPGRRCILFGFTYAPADSGRSDTYPSVVWVWDVQRERWQPDQKFSADLHMVVAVPNATPPGPSADATNLTVDHSLATTTAVKLAWNNNGDAASQTEIWLRNVTDGGSSVLWQVAGAGVADILVTGLATAKNYKAKVRHMKGGVGGTFTAEVDAYTLLTVPGLTALGSAAERVRLELVNYSGGATLKVERSPWSAGTWSEILSYALEPVGTRNASDATATCFDRFDYRARMYHPDWPALIQYSGYSATDDALACIDDPT